MSSIIETIAKQAQLTFSRGVVDEAFSECFSKLTRLVSRLRASDLHMGKDTFHSVNNTKTSAPVTYIEVTENQNFSIGVFIMKSGSRIPMHDHPGMHGLLKVIHGTLNMTSYSALPKTSANLKLPPDVINRVKGVPRDLIVPVQKHTSGNVTAEDGPCVLTPVEGNFHEISTVGDTAAFLDILAPPYQMVDSACYYYVPLETKQPDTEVKTWLLRMLSQPTDYFCDLAPYAGPDINL